MGYLGDKYAAEDRQEVEDAAREGRPTWWQKMREDKQKRDASRILATPGQVFEVVEVHPGQLTELRQEMSYNPLEIWSGGVLPIGSVGFDAVKSVVYKLVPTAVATGNADRIRGFDNGPVTMDEYTPLGEDE